MGFVSKSNLIRNIDLANGRESDKFTGLSYIGFPTMDKEISRKAAHNARVQSKLLRHAAPLFRERGPDHVGIDEMMGRAGMTRGAFYAHFTSKDEAFLGSLREPTPLLKQLEGRAGQNPPELLREMRAMFNAYLMSRTSPTAKTCTLAGLAMDVARGNDDARAAHEALQLAMRVEMARDMDVDHDASIVHAALSLAIGAVLLSAAQRTIPGQSRVLEAAREGVNDLFDGFLENQAIPTRPRVPVPPRAHPTRTIAQMRPLPGATTQPPRDLTPLVSASTSAPPKPDSARPAIPPHLQKPLFEPEPGLWRRFTAGLKKLLF